MANFTKFTLPSKEEKKTDPKAIFLELKAYEKSPKTSFSEGVEGKVWTLFIIVSIITAILISMFIYLFMLNSS